MKKYKITKSFRHNGKRYYIYGNTDKEVYEKMANKKRDLAEDKTISSNMLLSDWIDEWLNIYKLNSVSDRTYKDYLSLVRGINLNMQLKNIKPIHLQSILNSHSGQSTSHVKKIRICMNQIFKAAVKNKLISVNPAEDLVMPKTYVNTKRSLTNKEREYILAVADKHYAGNWIKIMMYCGCRPGETEILQGKDVDLNNDILHIRGTKTVSADRHVPIPHRLAIEFKDIKPFDYLFKTKNGNPLNKQRRERWWHGFKRAVNIEMGCKVYRNELIEPYPLSSDVVPYILRHTFCTDLQAAEIDINVAKELMGHSDITVTANIYTHFTDEHLKAAQNKLTEYRMPKGTTKGTTN